MGKCWIELDKDSDADVLLKLSGDKTPGFDGDEEEADAASEQAARGTGAICRSAFMRKRSTRCWWSCRRWTPAARTAPSARFSPASIRKASAWRGSRRRRREELARRLPLAGAPEGAGQGPDRRLQPLALRGRAGRAGQRPGAGEGLEEALRAPAQLRADAGRRGHHHPQVLPPHRCARSSASGCRRGSTSPTRTGSSTSTTWSSASTGRSTWKRSGMRSCRRTRRMHPGS